MFFVGTEMRIGTYKLRMLLAVGFNNDGHKPWWPTSWNLPNDVKWAYCTFAFGVSFSFFSRFHCCGRHD